MTRYALVGARLPAGGTRAVLVRDGVIEAMPPAAEVPGGVTRVDVSGLLLTPGLIDLHAHGAAGHGFDEPSAAGYEAVLAAHARFGVATLQASLATAELDRMAETLAFATRRPGTAPERGARLAGVHLEGPFLAPEQAGAHDPGLLRHPSAALVERLLAAGPPTMVTLAPELPGGLEAVRRFAAAGTVVAIGHSQAHGPLFAAAVEAGVRHLTHLWSGQSGLRREGPWRVPGLLEESLASTGLTAEVIADGRHLPPALLRIAFRCLGGDLAVVSDATPGAGLPDGSPYRLGALDCVVAGGVGVLPGTGSFAGGVTGLDGMLRHLHRDLGLPLGEAVAAATEVPARVLGLRDRGALRPGLAADLALFDEEFTAVATIVAGRWAVDLTGIGEPVHG
ncbi:amidohydrolase family protein [Nonomuraea sp. NPDC050310]|uniref:N-acetylglucosamine-6-phosphate deacetylase n=1 Tax=Nonomuraea sp. NPDC050310 TaxID=3154935 RepID=UPI0033FE16D4